MSKDLDKRSDKILLRLLEMIDTEMAISLLGDLRNPERRTPQLYQAINRFLDRHDFGIKSLMVDEAILGTMQAEAHTAVSEFLAMQDALDTKTFQ